MACNWRIRHKLMLGMTLVVAIMALLLGGTLKGLASYQATMRTFDSKLEERTEAENLKEAIKLLAERCENRAQEASIIQGRIPQAREALDKYRERLQDTLTQRRDSEHGQKEFQQVEALQQGFERFEKALAVAQKTPGLVRAGDESFPLLDRRHPVRASIDSLATCADDLIGIINDELRDRIRASRGEYRSAVLILVSTSCLAVLLMAGLLRFFYRWVVGPIRHLELGAGRVARGDFEQRLDIQSGDEMQDLAEAFNTMTDRLREMYTNLATQVNERSRQLVRSERLAGVGFLAAGVAHEINNPLASIAFCSEALERRLADLFRDRPPDMQEQETITKYLKMVQEEAFRCKEITQRLLAFSRGGDRTREETDLAEVIQGVLDVVQHLPNSKGKQLVFEPPGRISAWVNGQEIKQVFLNLVVNALDSMDEGGTLTITYNPRGPTAELVFTDTGCGMTPDVLENIFEPFFTRSRTGKGTGLGLSISHRIITQHSGEIEASSAGPGHGSSFRVRLPVEPPAKMHDGVEDVLDPEEEFLKLSMAREERRAA